MAGSARAWVVLAPLPPVVAWEPAAVMDSEGAVFPQLASGQGWCGSLLPMLPLPGARRPLILVPFSKPQAVLSPNLRAHMQARGR